MTDPRIEKNWPPEEMRGYEILFLDENTVVFKNDAARPFSSSGRVWNDVVIAFDNVGWPSRYRL